ncbi:class I SAM-dependent methyltransferase [Bacillus sp. 03113]|uniref:class I SAM-dependent methyltransferase n=1 Tax=Bacillus sp. 03113 TaxID=2578211 RepID=UPI0011447C82|nr:class I SAM-dependent methyltransferase [Bacillus sp. 03113]
MKHSEERVIQQFNKNALQYDSQRRKLIPCFDDFYSIPVSIIEASTDRPSVLDIGAGTGLFSSFVKEKYPEAKLTLVDLSDKMLEISKKRFKYDPSVNYITADYTQFEFNQKFDIIVSSLSIHHLSHEDKQMLYQRIFAMLKIGGVFVNADQVLGQTPYIESLYKTDWKQKIENSDLTKDEIEAAYERTKLDKMSTLEDQLNWLKESGFNDVDCVYKYFNFVVMFGRKL